MPSRTLTILAVLLACISAGNNAHAHKISVFAWVEDGGIQGETYFAGGTPARNCVVELQDASGKVLGATSTNDQGRFYLPLAERDNLKIIVYAGEGHQAIYEMKAGDAPSEADDANRAEMAEIHSLKAESEIGAGDVEKAVERALEKKLGPIRKQLAEMRQQKTSLKDIIAGVGFILGIFGAWALGRRSSKG